MHTPVSTTGCSSAFGVIGTRLTCEPSCACNSLRSDVGFMPRLLLSLFFVFAAWLAGCGLSPRDRAVSDANDSIRGVEEADQAVADAINGLPEANLEPASFSPLSASLRTYMERAGRLNASLRTLSGFLPSLQQHVDAVFRPASETALQACQEAIDAFDSEASTQDDYRRAITRVGLCLQRYATAVTNVSAEYSRAGD